jgi:predicted nucleotidyltransferase
MADLFEDVRDSGFPFPGHLVHLFVGGSELHRAKVHGTDDLDIYGVYIEPPEMVLGLESLAHFVWSTAGDGRRNGPNDVDVTLYSWKKWAGLASKGNPTALHFLFAEGVAQNPIWAEIVKNKRLSFTRVRQAVPGVCRRPAQAHEREHGTRQKGATARERREMKRNIVTM